MSLDNINAALARAKEAAGSVAPATPSTAVASSTPALPAGRPVSMREMLAQGSALSVKAYLKVDRVAFLIGKDAALFQEFDVEFRFNEAQPFFGLRYGNSPAKYERSTDRITNSRNGRPWVDCIAEAQRIDGRCRGDYPAVDVPFTVVNDVIGKDKSVIVKAGEKIGWTSSITNFKDFKEFAAPFYSLMDQGVLAEDAMVRGKIEHVTRSGAETYGALTFVGFEVVDNGTLGAN